MAAVSARAKREDMTNGPLFFKMLWFAVPLMLSGMLQLLFSAMDMVVVGQYVGGDSVASIGTTYSVTNLLVNLFVGLSVGTSVSVAQSLGAKNAQETQRIVHTSVTVSVLGGIVLGVIGFFAAKPLLGMMSTPDDLLDQASLYMKIYFLGMPVTALYNFASAVLRSAGDTRRPLYFLTIAGVLNVGLNLFFVIVCGMGVEGVALATIISQAASAGLVVWWLCRLKSEVHLDLKKLTIHKRTLSKIIKIGLPAGVQGTLFALSNVLIQSSVNSFGAVAMAGNAASASIEGFEYVALDAPQHAALTFTGQNVGARKPERIGRILWICMLLETIFGVVFGLVFWAFGKPLIGLYIPNEPKSMEYALIRLMVFAITYVLCGYMNVLVGSLRGMGASLLPTFVTLTGVCGFRILWIYTFFQLPQFHSLLWLYLSYPISWALTIAAHGVCYVFVKRRLCRRWEASA